MWDDMSTGAKIAVLLVCLVLLVVGAFALVPSFRASVNTTLYNVQKADDATRYSTRKEVEDSCRAMMASYTSDKLTYMQYRGSVSEEKRSWAAQAMMRANKTAATYNEYVLKNSFVWDGNIPSDIKTNLPYLKENNDDENAL